MADCGKCMKQKVCNRKEVFRETQRAISNLVVNIEGSNGAVERLYASALRTKWGITVEPKCDEELPSNRYDD